MYSQKSTEDRQYVTSVKDHLTAGNTKSALLKAEEALVSKVNTVSLDDAAALIMAQGEEFERLMDIAHRTTLEHHGVSVGQIGPLYISSYCVNNCRGCDYRRSNKELDRKVLSLGEFNDELQALQELGYSTLELVSGSFAAGSQIHKQFLELVNDAKEKVEKGNFVNFAVSIDALTKSEYAAFVDDKTTLIQWQESYDPVAYRLMVGRTGTKADMAKRMDAYEEWVQSGGRRLGLGILAGLSKDFFSDVLMVVAHGKYLESEYGVSPTVIGIPRMQRAYVDEGLTLQQRSSIGDNDLLKMVAIYRIAFPLANIVASTREPQEMVRRILYTGGTFTNHTCSTGVGGYPTLLKILKSDMPAEEKKRVLREIQGGKNQQFFHPDPIYEEMKQTIEAAGKKIDDKKRF